MEALRGSRMAFELFIAGAGSDRRFEKLLLMAKEKMVPLRQRDKGDISRLCGTEHHQGVALRVEAFAYADMADVLEKWRTFGESGLIVVLDSVQDPHNLGAIIRSAACAGAVETIPVAQVANIAQTLEELKKEGFWIYGAVGGAVSSLYDQDFRGNVVVVIGGEGEGIRPLVRKRCDHLISIPIKGGVNSLNASVAGGVMLFEIVRQRNKTQRQS
jgi:23S rRNA (guanosine2251-2'-O)-methyltransferase